jgi:hypothetical protein
MDQGVVNAEVLNNRMDRWLQRAAVAVMVGVAVSLVGLGVAMYGTKPAPSAQDSVGNFGKAAEGPADKVTTVATATSK